MSDLDDLEAYEDKPTPIDGRSGQAKRKSYRKLLASSRASAHAYAAHHQRVRADARRNPPSLPKLSWLDRPDPEPSPDEMGYCTVCDQEIYLPNHRDFLCKQHSKEGKS